MRIIFFGSDELGIPALNLILQSKHQLLGVVTIPDQKKGRGQKLTMSPIKKWAIQHQVPVFNMTRVNEPASIQELKRLQPDVFLVASFGTILSDEFLKTPSKMSINIHPSLLPKYRGASPVVQALLNGDELVGTTIMKIAQRLDSGDILSQQSIQLKGSENTLDVSQSLAELSATMTLQVLTEIERGLLVARVQDEALATHCGKIKKTDAQVDWNQGAVSIHNLVRALISWPGVKISIRGRQMKLLQTHYDQVSGNTAIGCVAEINAELGIAIQTGSGRLWVQEIQPSGGRPMAISAFLNGFDIQPGDIVGE